MPDKKTLQRAAADKREGKAPTTQAGEFVREEIHHIREGKHGARSAKQAIAIGLSKARRAGVKLPAPSQGSVAATRRHAARDAAAAGSAKSVSRGRARATLDALKREGQGAASRRALARQATWAAQQRSPGARSAAARRAALTKGPARRKSAAGKGARSRARAKG